MKNKKLQKQLQKRAAHERVGAVALVIATLVGMVTVEHSAKSYLREATAKAALANTTARENELERMPVKFDDVLRIQTIAGS